MLMSLTGLFGNGIVIWHIDENVINEKLQRIKSTQIKTEGELILKRLMVFRISVRDFIQFSEMRLSVKEQKMTSGLKIILPSYFKIVLQKIPDQTL